MKTNKFITLLHLLKLDDATIESFKHILKVDQDIGPKLAKHLCTSRELFIAIRIPDPNATYWFTEQKNLLELAFIVHNSDESGFRRMILNTENILGISSVTVRRAYIDDLFSGGNINRILAMTGHSHKHGFGSSGSVFKCTWRKQSYDVRNKIRFGA